MKDDYKRKFRHIQPKGLAFFVTFRLFGSIPKVEIEKLKAKYHARMKSIDDLELAEVERNIMKFDLRKKYLDAYDKLLHSIKSGPCYFKKIEIMGILRKELHRFDGELYDLMAYSIMSNHVHILIDTGIQLVSEIEHEAELNRNYVYLSEIMKRIKGSSSFYINRALGIKGQFWDRESFDIYIRNERMLKNVIGYILNNPVKAGIVKDWKDYPGNYLNG